MTVIDARDDAVWGMRILRGPFVSVLSVGGFLLVWFIAAEFAQSRLLPGPGAVLEYIYQESVHGDLLTELGITLWRGGGGLGAGGGGGRRARGRPARGR